MVSTAYIPLVLFTAAAVFGIAGIVHALVFYAKPKALGLNVVRIALGTIGIGGAYESAFPAFPKASETYPTFTVTTVAFVGVALLGYLLPKAKSLKFSGVEYVAKDEAASEAIEDLESANSRERATMSDWTSQLVGTVHALDGAKELEVLDNVLESFVRSLFADFKGLVTEPGLKMALWVAGSDSEYLLNGADALDVDQALVRARMAVQRTVNDGPIYSTPVSGLHTQAVLLLRANDDTALSKDTDLLSRTIANFYAMALDAYEVAFAKGEIHP